MNEIIDIAELDCIYLSYDEPRADEFWAKISSNLPWAKRVHGVKGSDTAHKAASALSDTERFILIDGDNLPNFDFFNQQLRINNINKDCVFRWRAYNNVNGLTYGNGGISSWTKTFVQNMKTHEATDGSDETLVEFCFDNKYWAMHDVWSTTYPNSSQYHAWRAGFREGVKLCLDQGRRVSLEDFEKTWQGNRHNLEIWCTVGRDSENGEWAIKGARHGAWKVMFDDDWDYTEVREFDKLAEIYDATLIEQQSQMHVSVLQNRLGLNIVELEADQSKWFKIHNRQYHNVDVMLPERDYKRLLNETAKSIWR